MKRIITAALALLWAGMASAQCNLSISPQADTVCYGTTLSVGIPGRSFTPISYVWSDGSTSPTTQAFSSGTYTLTVTGYLGQSSQIRTVTASRTYVVRQRPSIQVVNGPWVCKLDTVMLRGESGYSSYSWSNGVSGIDYSRAMTGSGGGPILDTVSVWYTASLGNLCQANSDTIVIRGVRRPEGVGYFYCGDTAITKDSIPAGLVLTYIYVPQYEMEITQVSNPSNVTTYLTPLGTRKFPSSLLVPGELYSVRTRPVINGITYCWGETCTIGLASNYGSRLGSGDYSDVKGECEFYDLNGRLMARGEMMETLRGLPQGQYLIRPLDGGAARRYMLVR